ncbi:Transcriptional regulator, MarR family [Streptococcus sp. DD10]|uniref:MarR family winged helix-turn-helix transcriptional regulator n=1 Tax=Streptococcus sp. DD10 TaxID=1777878 RepID=UPI000795808A|nr:MarR family winged helix-turn-helix transcriptional regulator [Streptococcus sp. DD10]KXT74836.1 Transcriptional regulator, MarR family [Streptococcus sp. DD10]
MAEINDLLYQLRLADQTITQLFEKQLGISLTRYQILQFLLEQAPCSQITVQERLRIDQAALTRHFKILEEGGYVNRSRNPENQREVLVHVTEFAREQLVTYPPAQHLQVKAQMEDILSSVEQTQLSHLLEKLVSGLETITF